MRYGCATSRCPRWVSAPPARRRLHHELQKVAVIFLVWEPLLQEVPRTRTSSCLLAAPVNIKAHLHHRNGHPLTDLRFTGAGFFDFNPRASPTHAAAAHYASEAWPQRHSHAIPCAMLAKACCASRAGQQHQTPSSRGPRAGSARQAAAANRLLRLVQSAANAGQAETLVSGVAACW